ncbi:MAG: lamin tail domain-containing protein [Verrucomicrobiota bacterium]
MKSYRSLVPFIALAALIPATSHAQLRVTEVESSEFGSSKPDWFELSNFGSSSVDITGYTMDDNSASAALSVPLSGITSLAPGESVAFFEVAGSNPLTIQGFRDWWGLSASIQIGTYTGSGVGLSSTADGVNIYTGTAGSLVSGVSFGAATKGYTFNWDSTGAYLGLSVSGVNGAWTAPQDGDVGSPGVVPEPTTAALAGLGLAALVAARRRS